MRATTTDAAPTTTAQEKNTHLDAVRRLHAATEQLLDAAADRYGISRIDLRCLEVLEREGPLTASELAAASQLSPAAITKVLRRLDAAGYVLVTTPTEDRRRHVAVVSARHEELRRAVWGPVQRRAARILSALDEASLEMFVHVMRRLSAMGEAEAARVRAGAEAGLDPPGGSEEE